MTNILYKHEGDHLVYPYTYGVVYHNIVFTSLPQKTQSAYRVVQVDYKATTYRLLGTDFHPSTVSDSDPMISSFQGNVKASFGFYTSTAPGFIAAILPEFTQNQIESLFKRPQVRYLQITAGTDAPSEMNTYIAPIKAIAIDPDTLDDMGVDLTRS